MEADEAEGDGEEVPVILAVLEVAEVVGCVLVVVDRRLVRGGAAVGFTSGNPMMISGLPSSL